MGELPTSRQERQLTQEEREFLEALPDRIDAFLTNYPYQPLDFSLTSLGFPGQISFLALPRKTQETVKETWFGRIGFNPDAPIVKAEYNFSSPEPTEGKGPAWSGEAHATIYEAGQNGEGETYYLHQIDYPDGTTDYLVAPEDFIP